MRVDVAELDGESMTWLVMCGMRVGVATGGVLFLGLFFHCCRAIPQHFCVTYSTIHGVTAVNFVEIW